MCNVGCGTLEEVHVREAVPADAGALADVHAQTWIGTYVGQVADHIAAERVKRAQDRNWLEHAELRRRLGGEVLVLDWSDEVVGLCEFGPTEDTDEDSAQVGHIMRLYVLPAYQRRGGGRRLLDAACGRVAAGGFTSVTLWTPEDAWNRAHGFYRRLGWVLENARQPDGDIRYRLLLR